ncbi:threonine/serine exporter family protein [Kitasatospora sp. NPDC056327]|uniref:threonine/serine exporter family protein n=1 Tax=Kitasatospora sp. NPDC056327 TaxID=3345785 RepID=UPI0035D66BC2
MDQRTRPPRAGELTAFLARLTGVLLRNSGEGVGELEPAVEDAARALGGSARLLVVPDGAVLTVTAGGESATVTVRAFPEVFRLDQLAAVRPLLADITAGRLALPAAAGRLAAIDGSPPPYPWWAKAIGIVLFSIGFAPLMQPTWWEVGSTAVLGTVSAALAVAAGRRPRLNAVLPLVAAVLVSVVALLVFARTPAHGGPVLIMLPALFFFVPGDYLSAAAAELAAGHLTPGAVRLVYAVFLLVQLYVGVLIGLAVTGRDRHALFDVAAAQDLPRWALFTAWIVFTAGTVLAFAVPARFGPVLLLLVYLTVGVLTLATWLVGEVAGTFVASVVLSAAATRIATRPAAPPRLLLLLPGFFTLTVGSLGMRGLTDLAGGHPIAGFRDLMELVTLVTAIAVGLPAGQVAAAVRRGPAGAGGGRRGLTGAALSRTVPWPRGPDPGRGPAHGGTSRAARRSAPSPARST